VRNHGKLPVTADRVTAQLPLREARPARCTDKVSGPLLARDGLRLMGQQRNVLAPGERQQITVTHALRLASNSKTGCGFKVTLDVQAIQGPAAGSPSVTVPPHPSPAVPTATASTPPIATTTPMPPPPGRTATPNPSDAPTTDSPAAP
jgi:hypothetical protein